METPTTLSIDQRIKDAIAPLSMKSKCSMYRDLMQLKPEDLTDAQVELLFILSQDAAIQASLNVILFR